jgi:hypothetical protein
MARSKFHRCLNVAEKCSSVQARHLAKSLHVHIANQQRVARTLKLAKNNTSTWKIPQQKSLKNNRISLSEQESS